MRDKPFPIVFPMDYTAPNAPSNVFLINEPAPTTIPLPNYNGPWLNPLAGSTIKSLNPEPIFPTKLTGADTIPTEPIIENI